MVKVKRKLSMNCSSCLKDFLKLYYFNSDHSIHFDNHFYCKNCFRRLFRQLPEKVKLTFHGYKRKEASNV
jgi:hypothetical protein